MIRLTALLASGLLLWAGGGQPITAKAHPPRHGHHHRQIAPTPPPAGSCPNPAYPDPIAVYGPGGVIVGYQCVVPQF